MRWTIDTTGVQCQVTRNPEQKLDQNGKQKIDREGRPMWTTQVIALDTTGGEVLAITVAGAVPTVTVGQVVKPVGLEAIPWNNNGKHGVAFRASELKAVTGSTK
jgi:hypothetical protein